MCVISTKKRRLNDSTSFSEDRRGRQFSLMVLSITINIMPSLSRLNISGFLVVCICGMNTIGVLSFQNNLHPTTTTNPSPTDVILSRRQTTGNVQSIFLGDYSAAAFIQTTRISSSTSLNVAGIAIIAPEQQEEEYSQRKDVLPSIDLNEGGPYNLYKNYRTGTIDESAKHWESSASEDYFDFDHDDEHDIFHQDEHRMDAVRQMKKEFRHKRWIFRNTCHFIGLFALTSSYSSSTLADRGENHNNNDYLSPAPPGQLSPTILKTSTVIMRYWANQKTPSSALIVEQILKRIISECKSQHTSFIDTRELITVTMYRIVLTAWKNVAIAPASSTKMASSDAIPQNVRKNAALRANEILKTMETLSKESQLDDNINSGSTSSKFSIIKPDVHCFNDVMIAYAHTKHEKSVMRGNAATADNKETNDAFTNVVNVFGRMKAMGVEPNVQTYNALLFALGERAASAAFSDSIDMVDRTSLLSNRLLMDNDYRDDEHNGKSYLLLPLHKVARIIFDSMQHHKDIECDVNTLNQILRICSKSLTVVLSKKRNKNNRSSVWKKKNRKSSGDVTSSTAATKKMTSPTEQRKHGAISANNADEEAYSILNFADEMLETFASKNGALSLQNEEGRHGMKHHHENIDTGGNYERAPTTAAASSSSDSKGSKFPQQAAAIGTELQQLHEQPTTNMLDKCSYNTLMGMWSKLCEYDDRALKRVEELFQDMKRSHIATDTITYNTIISAYARMMRTSITNTSLLSSPRKDNNSHSKKENFNTNYAKKAEKLLDEMERVYSSSGSTNLSMRPTTITYNTVMNAWSKSGDLYAPFHVERLLDRMVDHYRSGNNEKVKPDTVTFTTVIDSWANYGKKQRNHAQQRNFIAIPAPPPSRERGMRSSAAINQNMDGGQNDSFSTSGNNCPAQYAEDILVYMEELEQQNQHNGSGDGKPIKVTVAVYNAVMNAWSNSGDRNVACERVENLLERMIQRNDNCRPNVVSYNILLKTYAMANSGSSSSEENNDVSIKMEEILQRMKQNDVMADCQSYSTIISAIAKGNETRKARKCLNILNRMVQQYKISGNWKMKPNTICFNSVLNACAHTSDNDAQGQKEVLAIATATLKSLQSSDYGDPDHITWGTFLKIWSRFSKQDNDTYLIGNINDEFIGDSAHSVVEGIFHQCCRDGQVGDMVLTQLQYAASSDLYADLLGLTINNNSTDISRSSKADGGKKGYPKVSFRSLPRAWTRNVREKRQHNDSWRSFRSRTK